MNQHYVPRSYLKHFAEQKGKEFFVTVYDKKSQRYFKANIRKICSEIDLYTLREGNPLTKDLLVVEKIYSNGFEPLYTKAYEILTNQNIHAMTSLQRAEMLIGIFQLYVRNPFVLKKSIAFHEREILKLYKEAKSNGKKGLTYLNEDFSFRDWSVETIIALITEKVTQYFKEKHIGGVGQLGDFHQRAIFDVSVIKDDSEFITTDNPLILEDIVSNSENPLEKSKEFFIALNKKVALRLYHDKTKQLNRIYRHFEPNGSVEIINANIIKNATRFVISQQSVLDRHNKFATNFLNNTSTELKIDMIRQILEKFPVTPDNKSSHELLQYYLNKYENDGGLTHSDVFEMHLKMRELSKDFIENRIT